MKKATSHFLFILSLILLSGCEALEMIMLKEDARSSGSVRIMYDNENAPFYSGSVLSNVVEDECVASMTIQPGIEKSGVVEYTYHGGGLLSDPDGNIYFYDKDGFIYDKDGNPNSDKVVFGHFLDSECQQKAAKTASYAKDFNNQPTNTDDALSNSDIAAASQTSASGAAPKSFTTSKEIISCYGNVIWSDFFPNAHDYNARAAMQPFPIQLTFDFENGYVEGEFCGSGETPNDGWKEGSADFCVSVKDSDLYQEFGGTWGFDGVWDVDLDMSAAQLHWVNNNQEWAYNGQHARFDAPFHGWIEPGDGSLYTDEVLPATFQFLCDFNPPDYIFN